MATPSTGKFVPVAAMVGLLAAFYVFIGTKLNFVLWVPFISWALFFMAGAKYSRLHKEIIGLTGGLFFAVILLYLLPFFGEIFGSVWALPVLVFLVVFVIVMLELTDWFELAPAYFFGFAGYFALLFGGSAPAQMSAANILNYWSLLMLGLGLGVLTQVLRDAIFNVLKVPPEQRQTIFDKEKRIS